MVIELNSKIFNKLKEATNMVADLETQLQKDKKCKEVRVSNSDFTQRRREYREKKQ